MILMKEERLSPLRNLGLLIYQKMQLVFSFRLNILVLLNSIILKFYCHHLIRSSLFAGIGSEDSILHNCGSSLPSSLSKTNLLLGGIFMITKMVKTIKTPIVLSKRVFYFSYPITRFVEPWAQTLKDFCKCSHCV